MEHSTALMSQWEVATQGTHQHQSSTDSTAEFDLPPPPSYPADLAAAHLPRLEEPEFAGGDAGLNGYGIPPMGFGGGMGLGFGIPPSRGELANENGSLEHSFGASFPYMFPSW